MKKHKIQFSKVLAFVLNLWCIIIDTFFVIYIVPHSGTLMITDQALIALSAFLTLINGVVFAKFDSDFLKKSFLETKCEKDNEMIKNNMTTIDNPSDIGNAFDDIKNVADKVNEVVSSLKGE